MGSGQHHCLGPSTVSENRIATWTRLCRRRLRTWNSGSRRSNTTDHTVLPATVVSAGSGCQDAVNAVADIRSLRGGLIIDAIQGGLITRKVDVRSIPDGFETQTPATERYQQATRWPRLVMGSTIMTMLAMGLFTGALLPPSLATLCAVIAGALLGAQNPIATDMRRGGRSAAQSRHRRLAGPGRWRCPCRGRDDQSQVHSDLRPFLGPSTAAAMSWGDGSDAAYRCKASGRDH